jgi:hypothetical protein
MRGGTSGAMWAKLEQTNQVNDAVKWINPVLFSVKANAKDTSIWYEATRGPNGEGFW